MLNQFLDQSSSEIGSDLSGTEYFELISAEQVLKDDYSSYDELEGGIIYSSGDGGIDNIDFFINNFLLNDDIEISTLKKNVSIRLVFVQLKTDTGFSEDAMDRLISNSRDLFDLKRDLNELDIVYNSGLLKRIKAFRDTYLALASRFPTASFQYVYATKGTDLHPKVERKIKALENIIQTLFKPVKSNFEFLGETKLLDLARRRTSQTSSLCLA